ncbi:MAG: hypothetical protein J0L56_01995 [Chitinophagales bacterium]|nr:hypothetical protein [Chitinophagales bacterium]
MKKITFTILFSICMMALQAQNSTTQKPAMDNIMRSNGRIFVVVAVMLIILAGVIVYLVRIDKKINRIEKEAD